jgi:hypothetical protein
MLRAPRRGGRGGGRRRRERCSGGLAALDTAAMRMKNRERGASTEGWRSRSMFRGEVSCVSGWVGCRAVWPGGLCWAWWCLG